MTSDELAAKLKERYPAINWQVFDPATDRPVSPEAWSIRPENILVNGDVRLGDGLYLYASTPVHRMMLVDSSVDVVDLIAGMVARGIASALLQAKPDRLEFK